MHHTKISTGNQIKWLGKKLLKPVFEARKLSGFKLSEI